MTQTGTMNKYYALVVQKPYILGALRKHPKLKGNVRKQTDEYQKKEYLHLAGSLTRSWLGFPLTKCGAVQNSKKLDKVRLVSASAVVVQGVSLASQLITCWFS